MSDLAKVVSLAVYRLYVALFFKNGITVIFRIGITLVVDPFDIKASCLLPFDIKAFCLLPFAF